MVVNAAIPARFRQAKSPANSLCRLPIAILTQMEDLVVARQWEGLGVESFARGEGEPLGVGVLSKKAK